MSVSEHLTWVYNQYLWVYLEWEALFNMWRENAYTYTSPYFLNDLSYFGRLNSKELLLRNLLLGP